MNGIKIILFLVVAIGFVAGCSDEVTRPQLQQTEKFTVDATASPTVATVGDWVVFHADKRGGLAPYQDYWYFRDQNVGVGDYYRQMDAEGFFTLVVVSYDAAGAAAYDSVTVTVLPPQHEPLSIDLDADPAILEVNNYTHLHTHVIGGVQPYQKYTFYMDGVQMGDNQVGWFRRLMDQQGSFTFSVTVVDSLGVTASDSATVSVVAPNTVEWCVPTNLVVSSSDRTRSEPVAIGHSGDFHLWGKLRFDTSPRKDVMIWFTYSDGSVRYHTIPDMVPERPAVVLVDLGFWTVEELQSVTLHLTTDPSKCDGTVRLLGLCGLGTMPNKSAEVDYIMTLNKEGGYTLIE